MFFKHVLLLGLSATSHLVLRSLKAETLETSAGEIDCRGKRLQMNYKLSLLIASLICHLSGCCVEV